MKICSQDDCVKPVKGRGLCRTHHQAALRAQGGGRTRYTRTCDGCGEEFQSQRSNGKLCSDECRSVAYRGTVRPGRSRVSRLPVDHPVRVLIRKDGIARSAAAGTAWSLANKGPLRSALESGNHAGVIAVLRANADVDSHGCWVWQRRIKDGYPVAIVAGKHLGAHRLSLEAKHGAPLGKQAAHHMCANTACVNPDHLQPVTGRDNTAEMLARTYMESRIADLEAALTKHAPNHPLLSEIGVIVAA